MKYAVRIIKNSYRPLKVAPEVEHKLAHGMMVIVTTEKGEEAHRVFLVNNKISSQWEKFKPEALPLVRIMNSVDLKTYEEQQKLEVQALYKCRELVQKRKLNMRLTQVRYTFDRKKITFYYTAPERVDFRELLKDLTQEFKRVRIDLRHIGVRDETSILQGDGICGNQYCCGRFLKKFESVNTKLARDQGIPMTPGKITGACGRLLCCLNYEYSNYIDAAKSLPPIGSGVMTPEGIGKVCSLNFLTSKVSVKLKDGKIKEYKQSQIEMVDQEVNIEIETPQNVLGELESDEKIDLKSLDNDRGSSTGNI